MKNKGKIVYFDTIGGGRADSLNHDHLFEALLLAAIGLYLSRRWRRNKLTNETGHFSDTLVDGLLPTGLCSVTRLAISEVNAILVFLPYLC